MSGRTLRLRSYTEEEYDGSYKEEKSSSEAPNEISLSLIDPNVNQPRKVFDDATLSELTNSIRIHGVISPIIVVPAGDRYMIISGERRFRAAKKAGLLTIPAIVRNYSKKEIDEISLIENLQREDLNPIETAVAIRQLMDDYKYTQEEVADRIGKSRPAIANTLRLLSLSQPVIDLVALPGMPAVSSSWKIRTHSWIWHAAAWTIKYRYANSRKW